MDQEVYCKKTNQIFRTSNTFFFTETEILLNIYEYLKKFNTDLEYTLNDNKMQILKKNTTEGWLYNTESTDVLYDLSFINVKQIFFNFNTPFIPPPPPQPLPHVLKNTFELDISEKVKDELVKELKEKLVMYNFGLKKIEKN